MVRSHPRLAALGLAIGSAALALPASAQSSPQYFEPAKLVKQGTPSTPPAGKGTVVVQVLVNADGTFKVQKVLRSTNPADNQAALEIAQSSSYRPATRGSKPVVSFYSYTLNFAGGGATSSTGSTSAGGGGLAQYQSMIRAGNYAGAKSGLTSYLQSNPNDAQGNALLGVADTFLNDYPSAAAAFDKAGTIPANFKGVAAKAYASAADSAMQAKNGAAAVGPARKAVELAPGAATYNTLGNAEILAGQYPQAVTDLEKARSLASSGGVDAKGKAVIDGNLVQAYVEAGQTDKAQALLKEIDSLDPSNTNAQALVVGSYQKKAEAATAAGNFTAAAQAYDSAAQLAPKYATMMYVSAASQYSSGPKPDFKAAKSEADKALAVDPNNAAALYVAGVALANDNKPKDAVTYLQKAKTSADAGTDQALKDRINDALKKLGAAK